MFIAILTYRKPLEVVDKYLAEHRAFLDKHYAAGKLITSGPRAGRVGGIIMLKTDSLEAAKTLLANDPFNIHEIAYYQIEEFTPTKFSDEGLKPFLV